jgi:uncharacterized protein
MTPESTELIDQWWAGTARRELLVQHCLDCAAFQFYPRTICTTCRSGRLEYVPASGAGTVETYSVIHRAAFPDLPVPYVVARVRLAEGPVLLSNLVDLEEDELACELPVRLRWRTDPDGRLVPVFGPADGGIA